MVASPGWRPPHCPHAGCDSHADPGGWRFKRKGFYRRLGRRRPVQRYLCQHCGRSFSSQTFSVGYWLRSPRLLRAVFFRLNGGSCLRQIAREFGISPTTVQRYANRLGRHCLLLHELLRPRGGPAEPVVLDGLRCIESGRYWPFDLNLLVGVSHFVYGFSDAELRRSGRMTPGQRRHRARLEARFGRPDGRATRRSVAELVARILPEGAAAEIRSDAHPDYPRALAGLRNRRIRHRTTSSLEPRTPRNPLFPANLTDLLLRHDGANHKRQTIAFSKRRQNALYRAALWQVERNYMRPASVRRKAPPPAVQLGVLAKPLRIGDVLAERLFPWRAGLCGWLRRCYFGRIRTRCLPRGRAHELQYAV